VISNESLAEAKAIAHIEFLEWTGANHLRHTKFVALRDDKEPRRPLEKHRTPTLLPIRLADGIQLLSAALSSAHQAGHSNDFALTLL
jgi:hypothetical protein